MRFQLRFRWIFLWGSFILKMSLAEFDEETFYKTCNDLGALCFGKTFSEDINANPCEKVKTCDSAVTIFEDPKYPNQVRFQLMGKVDVIPKEKGKYVAVGISTTNTMGNDSVVQCISDENEKLQIMTSWNPGKQNVLQDDKSYISNEWISYKNSILLCDFTRSVNSVVEGHKFDLKTGDGFYILLAMGDLNPGSDALSYHSKDRDSSSEPILKPAAIITLERPAKITEKPNSKAKTIEASTFFVLFIAIVHVLDM